MENDLVLDISTVAWKNYINRFLKLLKEWPVNKKKLLKSEESVTCSDKNKDQ